MAKPAGDVALAVSAHLRMRNTQTLILSLYRVILAVFLSYQNQTQEGQIDTTTVIEKFDKCLPICNIYNTHLCPLRRQILLHKKIEN